MHGQQNIKNGVISQDAIRSCSSREIWPAVGIVLPVYGSIPHLRQYTTFPKHSSQSYYKKIETTDFIKIMVPKTESNKFHLK